MGLLDRFRRTRPRSGDKAAEPQAVSAPDPRWREDALWRSWPPPCDAVRGESFYLAGFREVVGRRRARGYLEPVKVDLVRDPGNEHDPNAIRAEVGGVLLGHLARDVAEELARQVDEAGLTRWTVAGVVRGGYSDSSDGGASNYGLHIWLDRCVAPAPPPSLLCTSASAVDNWPPHQWEGRGTCPGCGGFKWMKEVGPGRLACERCGHEWAG